MKIFNWMHRKWHPSGNYMAFAKDVLDVDFEEEKDVMEKEALLLHDVLNGILTIGTLGHQNSFLSQYFPTQEDEVIHDQEEENIDPEGDKSEGAKLAPAAAASEPSPVVESFKFELLIEAEGKAMKMVVQQDVEEIEKVEELPLLKEDKEKGRVGRTTLADLFAADPFVENDPAENASKLGTNAIVLKQHAASEKKKKKKKQMNKKEEKWTSGSTKTTTSTTRKLQKLITKMLKKKIHPEMAAVPRTADMQVKNRNKAASDGPGSSIYAPIELVQV